jgi:hypothetical protein
MKPRKTWRSGRVSDFWTATDKKIMAMILGNQGGQSGRRRGLENTVALMEKPRKTGKPRQFEDLLSQPCPFHKTPSTRQESADSSENWILVKKVTKARPRRTKRRMRETKVKVSISSMPRG